MKQTDHGELKWNLLIRVFVFNDITCRPGGTSTLQSACNQAVPAAGLFGELVTVSGEGMDWGRYGLGQTAADVRWMLTSDSPTYRPLYGLSVNLPWMAREANANRSRDRVVIALPQRCRRCTTGARLLKWPRLGLRINLSAPGSPQRPQ